MNSRERVINALKHLEVDRLPRHLWSLPGISMFRRNELEEVLKKYPQDFQRPNYRYGTGRRCKGTPYIVGEYTDAWGTVWKVLEAGVIGEAKDYPIKDWSDLDKYELPWELLNEADLSQVNRFCSESDKFIQVGTVTRPFERMQFLRGTENILVDIAYGEKKVYELLDRIHEFSVKEMKMWADTDVDGVQFMDDWGSQNSLLINPTVWRDLFKPLYKEYCNILHNKGKYVFFHSDGNIESILPDLVEIGVDALNSQLFCMDIEKLGKKYSGKITFWGEIDRQHILPLGTINDVRKSVNRVASAVLGGKRTGVIAQCEWGLNVPKENIMAVFDEWNKY